MSPTLAPNGIRALLLDIEGTTTPVNFVYGTLFPYARARVEQFLAQHSEDDEVAAELAALKRQRADEVKLPAELPPWREDSREARLQSAAAYIRWLMDRDRKDAPLKALQGKIWEAAYLSGDLRGQVYPDVAPAFARWSRQQRAIGIFSSGSVLAQKLLFAYSTAGDLTRFIRLYFDTSTGPKQDDQSYRRIAVALGFPPAAVLFLSDVLAELDAAHRAGLHVALCLRPGVAEPGASAYPTIRSFDEVFP